MNSKKQTVVSLALAALMVAGTAGLAMAADPTSNTETTDTTYTTELDDGDTIQYNESLNTTHSFSADSENASVAVYQDGTELGSWDNSTSMLSMEDAVDTDSSGTVDTWYYNITFDQDTSDFEGIEAGPGENVSLTIERTNDVEADSPDTSNVTVFFENDANLTFANFGSDDVETSEPGSVASTLASVQSLYGDEVNLTNPAKADRSVDVAGDDQDTITVHIADSDAQDALNETYHESADVGGITFMGVAMVGDTFVPVTAEGEDLPDWVPDDNAHLEVSEGGDQVQVNNAGAPLDEDDESTDLTVVGNEQANFGQIRSMMSDYGASTTDAIWTAATQGELVSFGEQFELEA